MSTLAQRSVNIGIFELKANLFGFVTLFFKNINARNITFKVQGRHYGIFVDNQHLLLVYLLAS